MTNTSFDESLFEAFVDIPVARAFQRDLSRHSALLHVLKAGFAQRFPGRAAASLRPSS
jgi:hypothetical protein